MLTNNIDIHKIEKIKDNKYLQKYKSRQAVKVNSL
jgi:hypothetical protein